MRYDEKISHRIIEALILGFIALGACLSVSAIGNRQAKAQSEEICKDRGGVKSLSPFLLVCNDGREFGPVDGPMDYRKVWVREQ